MQSQATVFLFLSVFFSLAIRAEAVPLVVVSSRQYLVQGASTMHLYLYGLDGKLRKQLTNDDGQDDHHPLFSHDGKSVLFSRVTTGAGLPKQDGHYILQLADGTVTRLPEGSAVDDAFRNYAPTIETAEFDQLASLDPVPGDPDPGDGKGAVSFTAPDQSGKLIQFNSADPDAPKAYALKTTDGTKPRLLSDFPGYENPPDSTGGDLYLASKSGPFLVGPAHYGALFVNRHRESMWVFACRQKVWHKIQSEWVAGDIYAPRNKEGFYFVRCSLEPLGNTGKTVLSAYLEWWDARFLHSILSPSLSVTYGAATFYGNGETSSFVDEARGS